MNPCHCGGARHLAKRRTITSVEVVTKCDRCENIEALPRREVATLTSDELTGLRFVEPKRKRRPNSKTRAYQAALGSAHTRKIREERFALAGDECEVRRSPDCTGAAEQLYHLTYERLGNERLEDVRASCAACNQDERQARITRRVLG